jgi:thioredoxin reductase (NADPH)
MTSHLLLWPYGIAMALIWGIFVGASRRSERRAESIKQSAIEAGLAEPVSLHPVIDVATCMGCGTCVLACPEGDVLGIIGRKVELIEPTRCIGHGACEAACPTGAIKLVFGTAERGVDLPVVGPDFQSNVPGIFIAGELGGMGLIRNAVNQGQQAVAAIAALPAFGRTSKNPDRLDLVIVGAGPAGISAALAAKERGLKTRIIEQDDLGGTVFKYPRAKVVMTAPATLPIIGKVNFREVSKEQLLAFWKDIEKRQQLPIHYRERVTDVQADEGGFTVTTDADSYPCRAVLLAIGRRGTPRQLGVPGEGLPKVVYQLIDPEQYRGKHVLVVGGGDSALEAAASIAKEPGTVVTLSYRNDAFGRARVKNRESVNHLAAAGRIQLLLGSEVAEILPGHVDLALKSGSHRLRNDRVIICAGGVLPHDFLRSCGIEMETKYGTA